MRLYGYSIREWITKPFLNEYDAASLLAVVITVVAPQNRIQTEEETFLCHINQKTGTMSVVLCEIFRRGLEKSS